MAVHFYELDTLVRFSVVFTNTATEEVLDPGQITFWVEDPEGVEQDLIYGTDPEVVRTNIGQYYCDFTPRLAGKWVYKWQGTPPAEVTSRDTFFIVNRSTFPV
jgi:hypothetical protein